MATKQFRIANVEGMAEGDSVALSGKNGFFTRIGYTSLLCNAVTLVDEGGSSNGNVQITVVGFPQLYDDNFNKHLLQTNDSSFNSLKGYDYVTVPIEQFEDTGELVGFVGYNSVLTNYSANIVGYDTTNSYIKFENQYVEGTSLFELVTDPPFYVQLSQILDPRYFPGKMMFIEGATLTFDKIYNISGSTGIYTANLGVTPKYKESIQIWIDGILQGTSAFTWSAGLSYANITISSSDQQIRTRVTHYTTPPVEVGDNISIAAENVYSVINSSYSIESARYNAALTANSIYKIYVASNLTANLYSASVVNISPDIFGKAGNVNAISNTFTIDYDSGTYPGNFNLANNKLYKINVPLTFDAITLNKDQIIEDVPTGINIVKARNINTQGRKSPTVTKSILVSQIPIQKVQNLNISESLYEDTSQGIQVRIVVSFDAIMGQEVSNYEISWKLDTEDSQGTFNTVVVGNNAIESDGKIRFTINNVERGRTTDINRITVRVVAFNNEIHGIPTEVTSTILGKSQPPQNVQGLAGGQQNQNILFVWSVPTNADGSVIDLDLNEIIVKKIEGTLSNSEYETRWADAQDFAKVATPASSLTAPITEYGNHTYLFRTKDTSKNESTTTVGITINSIRPPDITTYKAWKEDEPARTFAGLTNDNSTEYFWPSFANSVTGGLSFPGGTRVDNANGTSSGFSAGTTSNDIVALANAFYVTQVRDVGNNVLAYLSISANGTQQTGLTFNNLREIFLTSVSENSGSNIILWDIDNGGIGSILGFNNANAAVCTYDANLRTLISGGSSGNVWAIWNPGQFAGDVSNSNSFALIAGIINANALALSNTYSANGVPTGSNNFTNVTTIPSSYELVNLLQFTDPDADITFQGQSGAVTVNSLVRFAQTNVFYSNGNVNVAAFTNGTINDGWEPYSGSLKSFRWFQIKTSISHLNPTNTDYTLDELDYTVELTKKSFSTNVITGAGGWANVINYSNTGFIRAPVISLTIANEFGAIVAIVQQSNQYSANIRAASQGPTAQPGVNVYFFAEGI